MADKKEKDHLLYVDDSRPNLSVFRIAFKKDYKVHVVEGGEAALEVLEKEDIKIVVTDQRMPKMTGLELLEQVAEKYPDVIRIIISEYANDEIIRDAEKSFGIHGRVSKPWDADALREMIAGLLNKS